MTEANREESGPPRAALLLNEALAHHKAGRLQEAEEGYREILRADPDHAEANHLLGLAAFQAGRHGPASEHISRAIRSNTGQAQYHKNLGNALFEQGRLEEATAAFERAVALAPDFPEAQNNLATALRKGGRAGEARAALERVAAAHPEYESAHQNLGTLLLDEGKPEEALAAFGRVIALRPDRAEAHYFSGCARRDLGRTAEALAAFERAIKFKPDYPDAHNLRGATLQEKGRPEEALAAYERAIDLRPDFVDAHNNRGNALQALGRLEEALAAHGRAVALRPDYPEAITSLGNTHLMGGRLEEAMEIYGRALAIDPDFGLANFNLSLALLLRGDLPAGFRRYESRWETDRLRPKKKDFPQPAWDGSPPRGKTVLLYIEQGIGDTFQFVRYAKWVAGLGAKVVLECQPGLEALLAPAAGVGAVCAQGEALPAFDLHASLMSLPLLHGTTRETIPAEVPYLRPPPDPPAVCGRISEVPGFKVGLVWAGNPTHANDRNRSIALGRLAPLLDAEGVRFFGLQAGERSGEIARLGLGDRIEDLSGELKNFSATASVLERLDLLVSVDTAPAHLAGAMGRPVWTLLPFVPDWRWMQEGEDSPWYPTMRLFRQRRLGDWEETVGRVKKELERMAG